MNRMYLVLCCFLGMWQATANANSWNDLSGASDPDPGPICKEGKPCISPLSSNENANRLLTIAAADLNNNNDIRSLNSALLAPDVGVQLAALKKLAEKPASANVDNLKLAIKGKDIGVGRMSMFLLGQISSFESGQELHRLLLSKSTPLELKVFSAKLLGESSYDKAIPDLQNAIKSGIQELAIESAISLAKLGDSSGLVTLYESSLSSELGEGVRENSILALELITGKQFGYTAKYFAPVSFDQKQEALAYIKSWWSENGADWMEQGGAK